MRTTVFASAKSSARVSAIAAPQSFLIWLVPLLYPVSLSAIFRSAELTRANVALGSILLMLAIGWSVTGPVAGMLVLNYLDGNSLDRSHNKLVVHGALLAAISPPLFTGMRQISNAELMVPAWYLATAIAALTAFLPAPDFAAPASAVKFRRIHATSAIVLTMFAAAHVFNHTLGIVSVETHTAVLRVLRLVYRQRLGETILVAAVAVQVCTGVIMVGKSYLRRADGLRNLQLISGMYLAVFLVTHLVTVFTTRHRGIDTNFAWATSAPAGLLGKITSVPLLPRYSLAVLAVFVHLGCQARWNLTRVMSESAARKVSYGLMAMGGMAATTIALAACGVHLMK